MLQSAPAEEPITYGMAPLSGEVRVVDNCLRLDVSEAASYALIFPASYTLAGGVGGLEVLSASRRSVLTVGKFAELGGAELPADSTSALLKAGLEGRCEGPYFLVLPTE